MITFWSSLFPGKVAAVIRLPLLRLRHSIQRPDRDGERDDQQHIGDGADGVDRQAAVEKPSMKGRWSRTIPARRHPVPPGPLSVRRVTSASASRRGDRRSDLPPRRIKGHPRSRRSRPRA